MLIWLPCMPMPICSGLSARYTAVIFELLDLSRIGFIRMKDFKFLLAIFCDGSPGLRLRELFLSFDTDGNGQLSAPELTQLVAMINALRPSSYGGALDDEQISDMLMMELDIEHHGEISCEEFVYQSQGSDSLTDIFLGVVDGFHKAEAGAVVNFDMNSSSSPFLCRIVLKGPRTVHFTAEFTSSPRALCLLAGCGVVNPPGRRA